MTPTHLIQRLRIGGWCLAALSAGVSWMLLQGSIANTKSAAGLAVLGGFAGGLGVELLILIVGDRPRDPRLIPSRPFRAADGVVEVLAVRGVVGEALAPGSPWQRFIQLDPSGFDSPDKFEPSRLVGMGDPPLMGQIVLISTFVGRDGRRWSPREIANAHESLRSVGRWLEREAIARNVPLNVGLADTYFEALDDHDEPIEIGYVGEGDSFGPMENHASTKAVASVSRVAAALGFLDIADLVTRINPRVDADSCAWLVHVKRRGRSYAIPAGEGMVDGVGLAICYAREASFPAPLLGTARVDPTTVVHELLHLCGASDKYGVPLETYGPGLVSRQDVMRLDEERLNRLRIGKLTASEIGWE